MKRLKGLECPTCGRRTVDIRKEDLRLQSGTKEYVVKDVEFWQCAGCNERMYSPEAVKQIQSVSPAFRKSRKIASGKKKAATKSRLNAHRSGR